MTHPSDDEELEKMLDSAMQKAGLIGGGHRVPYTAEQFRKVIIKECLAALKAREERNFAKDLIAELEDLLEWDNFNIHEEIKTRIKEAKQALVRLEKETP